jgi:hypothetical protein
MQVSQEGGRLLTGALFGFTAATIYMFFAHSVLLVHLRTLPTSEEAVVEESGCRCGQGCRCGAGCSCGCGCSKLVGPCSCRCSAQARPVSTASCPCNTADDEANDLMAQVERSMVPAVVQLPQKRDNVWRWSKIFYSTGQISCFNNQTSRAAFDLHSDSSFNLQ